MLSAPAHYKLNISAWKFGYQRTFDAMMEILDPVRHK